MIEVGGLLPWLAALGCLGGLVAARAWASAHSEARARQLEQAAELLHAHAEAMARVLDSPMLSDTAKGALVALSDGMGDRQVVLHVARRVAAGSLFEGGAVADADAGADREAFRAHPELRDDFHVAFTSLLVGAMLRWPDTAALLGQVTARVAVRPPSLGLAAWLAGLARGAMPGRAAAA